MGSIRNETVSNAVAEGNKGHDNERGENIADISPVDLGDLPDHHTTNLVQRLVFVLARPRSMRSTYQNEGTASCPWRDRSKDGSKEDGNYETKASHHGRQPASATLGDTSTTLDEGRTGRRSEECANGDEGRINAIRNSRSRKVAVLGIHDAAESHHGVQRRRRIDDVDVEEREEREGELGSFGSELPVKHVERLGHRVEGEDLLEEGKAGIAFGCEWEVCDGGVATWEG